MSRAGTRAHEEMIARAVPVVGRPAPVLVKLIPCRNRVPGMNRMICSHPCIDPTPRPEAAGVAVAKDGVRAVMQVLVLILGLGSRPAMVAYRGAGDAMTVATGAGRVPVARSPTL